MRRRVLASVLPALFVMACSGDRTITAPAARLAATVLNAIGTDPVTGATIETNKDDYLPGEVVHLAGRGWAPGETVHLFMSEEPDTHGDVSMDVQVDSTGAFSLHFYDVQEHDLGVTFTLTATGQTSGSVATAVFTDGIFKIAILTSPAGILGSSIPYIVRNDCNTGTGASAGSYTVGVSARIDVNGNKVLIFEVPTVGGYTFQDYTAPGLTVAAKDDSLCISGGSPSGPDQNKDITLNYVASNLPPTANPGGPYTGSEGSDITLDGTGSSDPDGSVASYAWNYSVVSADAGATCSFDDATSATPKIKCTDDGSYTIKLVVTDDDGATSLEAATSLTVSNVAPTVSITAPLAGAVIAISDVGTLLNVAASFSDAGTNDTHTCSIDWGNATGSAGVVSETPGTGTCSKAASATTYSEAGVYVITVTVSDDDGDSGSATVMIVVYDPSAGFVTGGGWINVSEGSFPADVYAGGKATFGFVSRYKKGATVPDGNTQFVFHAAGFSFHSIDYQWLVVNQNGTNAQFKGTGAVNGVAGYSFMLWATDDTPDLFRIKIWETVSGTVVFDNLLGQGDTATPQAIEGGSIQIHTGGKK